MILEISTGAVLCYTHGDARDYVLVRHRKNNEYGFPKGHIEAGETEEETALREILEECGTHATLIPGFREVTEYMMPNGNRKRVIFFAAFCTEAPVTDPEEAVEVLSLPYAEARAIITYDDTRAILDKAEAFFQNWNR